VEAQDTAVLHRTPFALRESHERHPPESRPSDDGAHGALRHASNKSGERIDAAPERASPAFTGWHRQRRRHGLAHAMGVPASPPACRVLQRLSREVLSAAKFSHEMI